ncbi:putative alpha-E superfamily protein [Gammaproteobacteria bacterium]
MLSRVAENLYWMTRYLERADNTARLINSTTQVLLDLPVSVKFGWDVLIKISGLDNLFLKYYSTADESSVVNFLIQDKNNPGSILSCIHYARENTRTFREVLPMEFWERINGLYLYIQRNAHGTTRGRSQRYEVLSQIIERRQSIVGLVMGSMSHDAAYQFIKLGRNLERADMTTRIVDINSAVLLPNDESIATSTQERLWMATLTALSAYQMYRQHVGVHVLGHEVVNFLLNNFHFPRTVNHCLTEIENCLSMLPNHNEPMKMARRTSRRLATMPLDGLQPMALHEYLDQIQADLGAIHNAVSQQYFYLYQTSCLQNNQQSITKSVTTDK